MRHIDEDTITQAVIARHAAAGDARLREVMTSLVQHLHAFVRDVKLTEAEWQTGLQVLADCSVRPRHLANEMGLLADALGVSTLVGALARRSANESTTEPSRIVARSSSHGGEISFAHPEMEEGPAFYVVGRVCARSGRPLVDVQVHAWPAPGLPQSAYAKRARTAADGSFVCRFDSAPQPYQVAADGMAGRLLTSLDSPLWRPEHVYAAIAAPGYRPLVTHLFREHGKYLDSDALFAVRRSLVVPWVDHRADERTPDGQLSHKRFTTVEFTFVLEEAAADATPTLDFDFALNQEKA